MPQHDIRASPAAVIIFPHTGQTYSSIFLIFMDLLRLTILSPERSSGTVIFRAAARGWRSIISGNPLPVSHLDTVLSLT